MSEKKGKKVYIFCPLIISWLEIINVPFGLQSMLKTLFNTSLVPKPRSQASLVFVLRFAYNTQKRKSAKNRKGLVSCIMWVNARWTLGGGAQPQKQCTGSSVQAIYRSSELKTLAWSKLLVFTSKKLALRVYSYILEYQPLNPPYIIFASTSTSRPPNVTNVMDETRPSPFFHTLPLLWIILNANRRTKDGGGLGMRLVQHLLLIRDFDYHC